MANIVPKLNLNKTPSIVENNSLVFAKNIRLDVDKTIHKDYSIFPFTYKQSDNNEYIHYINLAKRIAEESMGDLYRNHPLYYCYGYRKGEIIENNKVFNSSDYKIVGVIPGNNEFFLFISMEYTYDIIRLNEEPETKRETKSLIVIYDEKEDLFKECPCNWNYNGGKIDGYVINNLRNEKILVIAENNPTLLIPLKCINLNVSTYTDDESIYTQTPNIPITNIFYNGIFSYTIPNGVYQFFIRYKIRDNFYTNWILASRDIFAGNQTYANTSFGTLKYTNTRTDCDSSFLLKVEHLIDRYKNNYKSFQVGFILSHDDDVVARAWKHFSFDVEEIPFDYKASDAEEIEVIDLLKPIYNIYNVGNITSFKNKLYISNYLETNNNDDNLKLIIDSSDKFNVSIGDTFNTSDNIQKYGDWYIAKTTNINHNIYINELSENAPIVGDDGVTNRFENARKFSGDDGIIKEILNQPIKITVNNSETEASALEVISKVIKGENNNFTLNKNVFAVIPYKGFECRLDIKAKKYCKNIILTGQTRNVVYNDEIVNYKDANGIKYKLDIIKPLPKIDDNQEIIWSDSAIRSSYNAISALNSNKNFVDVTYKNVNTLTIDIIRTVDYEYLSRFPDVPQEKPDDVITGGSGEINRPSLGGDNPNVEWEDGFEQEKPTTWLKTSAYWTQTISLTFVATEDVSLDNVENFTPYTTLIPYQTYKFYVHFIRNNGEITNGYFIDEKTIEYKEQCNGVIYPIFPKITKGYINNNNEYVGYFFSMIHTKTNASTIFNTKNITNNGINYIEGQCIELNSFIISKYRNILCRYDKEHFIGNYYHSSDNTYGKYFGNSGYALIETNKKFGSNESIGNLYITDDYKVAENESLELIKCTPYYLIENDSEDNKLKTINDWRNFELKGYICNVNILDNNITGRYYSDGSSIFQKVGYSDSYLNENNNYKLKELSKYKSDDSLSPTLENFSNIKPKEKYVTIYSNYNLNYLTITEEPKLQIKTYYNRKANDTPSADVAENDNSDVQVFLRLLTSLTISNVYSLPSMYKSYTTKNFYNYEKNSIIQFNNTIRSSVLIGDESNINIFTFDANDYYSIPTNRGIIVNLISVGDAILVHTEDSMFKFTGSNSMQSSDGEIKLNESNPFDTGVSEVFGSDFGFAGIQNKLEHIVTELGYIFFDSDSKIIYMYSGNSQITKLSNNIEKLITCDTIDKIVFGNDYYNNRFFINIKFKNNNYATLSFNFLDDVKDFISLHDFNFEKSFNTKTKCYFLDKDGKDIFYINKNDFGTYTNLGNEEDIYPTSTYNKTINISNGLNVNLTGYASIIDFINNFNYETIKTLNSIEWCSNYIIDKFITESEDSITLKVADTVNQSVYTNPCDSIFIYSDTCSTKLLDCTNVSNRATRGETLNIDSYKYPRYNQGKWNLNYFRNVENIGDTFEYESIKSDGDWNYDNGRNHNIPRPDYISDANSLIDGKYIVARFTFTDEFKFETLSINYDNKF